MGILGIAGAVVGVVLLATGAAAGYLYATDYAMEADVKEKECQGPAVDDLLNVVAVRTRLLGIDHDVRGVPDQPCTLLEPGDRVVYRIRSKHTTLYDSKGDCRYDSETGIFCGQALL